MPVDDGVWPAGWDLITLVFCLQLSLIAHAIHADCISSLQLYWAPGPSLSGEWLPRAVKGLIVAHGANSSELKGRHFPVGLKCQST